MTEPLPARRAAVLIVDDDDPFLKWCVRVIQVWEHEAVPVTGVEDALRLVRERDFDVILSDINLPGASGIEFLRAVRVHDKDVPVILMTGGPEIETARLAVECGAQSYLIKPLSLSELKESIERNISAHYELRRQRKILAVMWALWRKEEDYDPQRFNPSVPSSAEPA